MLYIYDMEKDWIVVLKKLGINPKNSSREILEDLLNVAEYLYEELEKSEIEKFRAELKRLKQPTN